MRSLSFIFFLCFSLSFMACSNNNSKVSTDVSTASTTPKPKTPDKAALSDNGTDMTNAELKAAREQALPEPAAPSPKEKITPVNQEKKSVAKPAVRKELVVEKKAAEKKLIPVKEKKTVAAEAPVKTAETILKTPRTEPEIEKETTKPAPPPAPKALSHTAWDGLLRKHVSATGKVNYKGLKADKTALEAYLAELAANPVQNDWSRGQKMAYWINAYNAFTVKMIVDNYPIASITKLHGGKPWDANWIKLGDKTYSLNNIENDILRPTYKDARIHFAVNCAAQSCPPLLNRAWTASNLNSNFEKQAKAFINNSKFNQIGAKSVTLSKIFDWYGDDFGDLIGFLNKYAGTSINKGAKVDFMEYDWSLNE